MDKCQPTCDYNHKYLDKMHICPPTLAIPEVFGKELSYYERVCAVEQKVNEQINFLNTQLDCLIAEHMSFVKLAGDYTEASENLRLFLQSRCEDIKDANAGVRTKSAEFVVDFNGDAGEFKSKIYDFIGIDITVTGDTINMAMPGGQYIVYADINGTRTQTIYFIYNNGVETEYRREIDAGYNSPFSFTAKGTKESTLKVDGNLGEIRVKISLIKIGG